MESRGSFEPIAVANYHCVCGENPLWNPSESRIYWVDIETGRLFRADHDSSVHECFYTGDVVGGFTFQDDGSLLLFEANRIRVLGRTGARRLVAAEIDSDMVRFNDVIADPEGRVFAGTIGKSDQSGGLYRVDRDAHITPLFKGTGCANGMGFSPDFRTFYWTCSTTYQIFAFDYDRASGSLNNRRLWYRAPEAEGIPDGLTVAANGNIWTARWGGSAVYEMSPRAEILRKFTFPVSRVSSVTFGGPNLDVLYVTTAGGNADAVTTDGTLYKLQTDSRGRLEFQSRIIVP